MGNAMRRAVICMPYEMAMENEVTRRQFYGRAQSLLAEVERLESTLMHVATKHFAESLSRMAVDANLDDCLSLGIAQLEAELEQYREDAERYEFVRALENDCWMLNALQCVSGKELDEAIDAELAKEGGANG